MAPSASRTPLQQLEKLGAACSDDVSPSLSWFGQCAVTAQETQSSMGRQQLTTHRCFMLYLQISCELEVVQRENTILCNSGFPSRDPTLTHLSYRGLFLQPGWASLGTMVTKGGSLRQAASTCAAL